MTETILKYRMPKIRTFFLGIAACLMLLMCSPVSFAQTYDENVEAYINQYKDIAIEEMYRTGIPASITLAQGIIETNAGQSPLALEANNHFGIKCHDGWTGASYTYDDDRKNECFRKYDSAFVSYKDHSDFLRNRSRYAVLFTYDINDYKAWAKGLKACGYATNPQYANILIKCIDDYDLHQWDLPEGERTQWFASINKTDTGKLAGKPDHPTAVSIPPTIRNAKERIYVFNNIKCVTLLPGESFNNLATTYEIGMKRLMRYNDVNDASVLKEGDRIYLQPKRNNGDEQSHVVKEGETMFSISRDHGIQLAKLYEKNAMDAGTQPAAGEVINLKETRKEPPRLVTSNNNRTDSTEVKKEPAFEKPASSQIHIVTKGDTLYSISKKYNVTVNELKSINNLSSTDLRIGDKLVVSK